ncbi:nickel insertion protein [Alkalicoccus chagannorensis]|uniref:nickel insertion protein n=1 Tax=Alkalicoccus chagannorensis TaxID=427072 RepID=UPI0004077FB3|nr:nickel insertion protein [Alkalicoccus chagannorensis]
MPSDHEHIDTDMIQIAVNLDDISGEWLGHVLDKLLETGAADVWYTPIFMKKNRPGYKLEVLCRETLLYDVRTILMNETTTLGFRWFPLSVYRAERSYREVQTMYGAIPVKQGWLEGQIVQEAPEYEACMAAAERAGAPLKQVYQEVWRRLADR